MEFPNYLSMFLFSFFMMLTSPILLDISKYFNVPPENMNLIITFFLIGEATGILAFMFLSRKFNRSNIVIWIYVLVIPTLVGLVLTSSLIFFNILYFISGCLFGIIFMNSNLSMLEGKVKNKDSIINLGHGFFAIGALISPFIASSIISRQINWRVLYMIVIGLVLISLLSYLLVNKKQVSSLGEKETIPIRETFRYRKKNIYDVYSIYDAILCYV